MTYSKLIIIIIIDTVMLLVKNVLAIVKKVYSTPYRYMTLIRANQIFNTTIYKTLIHFFRIIFISFESLLKYISTLWTKMNFVKNTLNKIR
jgi:hypothetical protein